MASTEGHDAIHPQQGIIHPDFKDAYALMNAEVHELVKSVQFGEDSQQEVVDKTLQYVERFRKYKNLYAQPRSRPWPPPPRAARSCLSVLLTVRCPWTFQELGDDDSCVP